MLSHQLALLVKLQEEDFVAPANLEQVTGAQGENGLGVSLQVSWGTFAWSPITKPVLGNQASLDPVCVLVADAVSRAQRSLRSSRRR